MWLPLVHLAMCCICKYIERYNNVIFSAFFFFIIAQFSSRYLFTTLFQSVKYWKILNFHTQDQWYSKLHCAKYDLVCQTIPFRIPLYLLSHSWSVFYSCLVDYVKSSATCIFPEGCSSINRRKNKKKKVKSIRGVTRARVDSRRGISK